MDLPRQNHPQRSKWRVWCGGAQAGCLFTKHSQVIGVQQVWESLDWGPSRWVVGGCQETK